MDEHRTDPEDLDDDTEDIPRSRLQRLGRTAIEWGTTLILIAIAWVGIGMLRAPDLPDQAPGFTLPDLAGQQVSLADFSGQTVVLNFWATWCGPCRMEIPAFSSFADDNPEIPVLGIAVDGTAPELRRASSELGITYPVLIADAATKARYGVETLPTTVVVGEDGAVRYAHAGLMLQPQLLWATR
ncbi:MAG: thiol-disulfide isomerase/thioredoxin [Myxococcota bacterium]|jgi:thiol-disulfide isomerase/thioredoxin